MRGASDELDVLYQVAVAGAAYGKAAVSGACGRVHHHRHVDVVERPEPDELLFAGQQVDPALPAQRQSLLDVDELLGGERHQDDPSVERGGHLRGHQAHGRAQHRRRLAVVAACVGRGGRGIGVGVAGHSKTVHLADYRDAGAAAGARQAALDAGDRDLRLVLDAQLGQPLRDEARGLELPEPGLGVAEDRLGDVDEPLSPRVDGGQGGGLQRLDGGQAMVL